MLSAKLPSVASRSAAAVSGVRVSAGVTVPLELLKSATETTDSFLSSVFYFILFIKTSFNPYGVVQLTV